MTKPKGPKYPNQQLRSVSLETYFPGRLGAYAVFGEIQAKVEETLPSLFVPNFQSGQPSALRPFQMRDEAQSRSLAVAVNQVSFITFEYPGYVAFMEEALPVVSAALDCIRPSTLNRVIYRYENELGMSWDQASGLAVDLTFPGIVPPSFKETPCRAVNAAYEHGWAHGKFHGTRGFHARSDEEGGNTVFKVAVFAGIEGCEVRDLAEAAAEAHGVGVELFEALISPKFRQFISSDRGD